MEREGRRSGPARTGEESTAPTTAPRRAIVVSSMYTKAETAERIGREAYSYRFVYRAFAPLLQALGKYQ